MFVFQAVGGGWIEAQNSTGETGLVPEGYLQVSTEFHLMSSGSSNQNKQLSDLLLLKKNL